MKARDCKALVIVLLTFGLVGTGLATVQNSPYQIRAIEKPMELAAGQSGRLVLAVTAVEDLQLENIELVGPGWNISGSNSRDMFIALGNEELLVFDLVPDGNWEKLTLSFEANGRPVSRNMDLAPGDILIERQAGLLTFQDEVRFDQPVAMDKAGTDPEMAPVSREKLPSYLWSDDAERPRRNDKADRSVTLQGRLGFMHDDTFRPVFGATVIAEWRTPLFRFNMGSTTTDRDGNFSVTFQVGESVPLDVGFLVVAGNNAFTVFEDEWIERDAYTWRSFTTPMFTGTSISYGEVVMGGGYIGALNITNALSRTNVYLRQHTGLSALPYIDVWWPTSDGASYYDDTGTFNDVADIYFRNIASWKNVTHVHEYGHHFIHVEGRAIDAEYCNIGAFCDDPDWWGNECHHCGWCPENANVAFSEGFPYWLSDAVCREWRYDEPSNPIGARYFNSIGNCRESGQVEDAWVTENAFSALLHDMVSSNFQDDDAYDVGHDRMIATPAEVLNTVRTRNPISPWQFIFDFKDLYPEYNEVFWAACRNNGFDGIDTAPPETGTLSSPSHPLYEASPSDNIVLEVSGSSDDFSGVAGYAMAWQINMPPLPGTTINRPLPANFIATGDLIPGIYYVSVRAVDHAGKADPDYQTYGPVIVMDQQPSDLVPSPWNANWAHPLIPKAAEVADQQVIPADSDPLPSSTYWNASLVNTGQVTIDLHHTSVLLDGEEVTSFLDQGTAGGDFEIIVNQGPLIVNGGRHTFAMDLDKTELVAEPVEADNLWGKQWIWEPVILGFDTKYGRNSPPPRSGGWDSIISGTKWFNCSGFRIRTAGAGVPSNWVATWVKSRESHGDLDVRLHDEASGATAGFSTNLGYSARPAGLLDAVLVNSNNRLAMNYDVGVITAQGEEPYYFYIEADYGAELTADVTVIGNLGYNEGLDMFRFEGSPNTTYTVFLEQIEGDYVKDPLWLTWYGQTFATGKLMDYDGVALTDSTLGCSLTFDSVLALQNSHGFAVWRDPSLNDYTPQQYRITVRETPPDLAVNQPAGWAAPLVPRPSDDATDTSAPEPSALVGDQASTYINYSLANLSAVPTPQAFSVYTLLDGVQINSRYYLTFSAGGVATYTPSVANTVNGGRHTIAMNIDPADGIFEFQEGNNTFARQYVWRPTYMAWNTLYTRPQPSERMAGWDLLDAEQIWWPNCDGMRTFGWKPSGINRYWGAVAIIPGAQSDLDLDLHFLASNPREGFEEAIASSRWSQGHSDFVLMNFRNTGVKSYDVGILQAGEPGFEPYGITTASSAGLAANPDGEVGSFTMGTSEIVQLFEIDFGIPDGYLARLAVADPTVDLGFSLYGPDLVQGGKSDVLGETAGAWLATAGEDDTFEFTVMPGETGKHCLAVWKVGAADLPMSTGYTLTITRQNVSGAEGTDLPRATSVTGVYPNPFNPRTSIDFALAQSSPVRVSIHDLTGRLVAVLVDAELLQGNHTAKWEGLDDAGRRVASGTYFVQFRAEGVRETRKITLIK